jgi:NOL1/NOP2/sun family putative RNA methylase
MLPTRFLERMRPLLGDQLESFQTALEGQREYAIRTNTLKLTRDELTFTLRPLPFAFIPWCEAGLYATRDWRLGSHALHHAGAFYVQEPSAMAVAEVLAAQPGERVLDLCAAPGGKSTHIAAHMQNAGVLVCNEVNASRAKALAENLERLGCFGVVTNEEPERLARAWGSSFDRVLVDAPCSGEGMFRKNSEAIRAWSEAHVLACAKRQSAILESAAQLVKPGGVLVYSTCTFALEENEGVIKTFLESHPEFALEPITDFAPGFGLEGCARLWPHLLRGEGHFIAKLRKNGGEVAPLEPIETEPISGKLWREFSSEFSVPDGVPIIFKGEVQLVQPEAPSLEGVRVVRAGVPIAHLEKNRFEPHHGLSRIITNYDNVIDLEPSEVQRYLRGETLESEGQPGWVLLRTSSLALGWGKRVGRQVKNHYPKHLRGQVAILED